MNEEDKIAWIEEEITVDDVAKHCCYSKYHLMRMFKEDTDESLYQFIKRIRLERSAWRLKVEKDKSVAQIGVNYGYSSSNFATAFKKHLNISPIDFRKKSERMVEQSSFSHGISIDELEKSENLITVEELDSFLVVYIVYTAGADHCIKDHQPESVPSGHCAGRNSGFPTCCFASVWSHLRFSQILSRQCMHGLDRRQSLFRQLTDPHRSFDRAFVFCGV